MEKLMEFLNKKNEQLPSDKRMSAEVLKSIRFARPFNKHEFYVSHLIANGVLSLDEYKKIRKEYLTRHPNLYLFEMTSKVFGQSFGEDHILNIVKGMEKASKGNDENFDGEYDLLFKGIKVEVKASRAVDKDYPDDPLPEKALKYGTNKKFLMNFQQLKPDLCDVFVWIAVWDDSITYWVLSSLEVKKCRYLHPQHRNSLDEFQIMVTNTNLKKFKEFEVIDPNLLDEKIKEKSKVTCVDETKFIYKKSQKKEG